ncbi:predicted protein [Naegleria gruberi]|uniref:Predicted protein n=1 Tax=Naegleria gruberi TaxID=5762 RepID=D2V668_NAEGR|nr:uncharacterized protein NAEGRDRAFT_64328 [Naegleria gruberi]EFC47912.1 predicted protein [Naegleria gruberi]|eukprot:XP_002680656.1 predicted protein [Naegleria gruberi strain NEG-M]
MNQPIKGYENYQQQQQNYNHEDIEILENLNPHLLINHQYNGFGVSGNTSNSFVLRAFVTALSVCCFLLAVILMVLLKLNEEDGQLLWSTSDEEQQLKQEQAAATSTMDNNVFIPSRSVKHAVMLLMLIGVAMILHVWTSFSSSLFYYALVGFILVGLFLFGRIVYRFVVFMKKQEEENKKRLARVKRFFV